MTTRLAKIVSSFRCKLKNFKFTNFRFSKTLIVSIIAVVGASFLIANVAFAFGTDDLLRYFNQFLFWIARGLGTVAMWLFGLVVFIASYNDFLDQEAVTKGWYLIRDVCNMFFVVLLLVIAFGTILRIEKYQMKTMLPGVLKAAVLVNFSKLICGLIIDAGQVVMMTFVNGFSEAAGGNLVTGIGLSKLMQLNTPENAGVAKVDIMIGLMLAIFLVLVTIVVVFMLAAILTIRLVVLWFLIVLSPLAFLLKASPVGSNYASQWWSRFGNYVAVGPLIAFFLWLSLLIMGSGNVFGEDQAAAEAGKELIQGPAMAYLDNLGNFAISIGMLFATFKVASEVSGLAGAAAGRVSAVSRRLGRGALKFAASPVTTRVSEYATGYREIAKKKTERRAERRAAFGAKVYGAKESVVEAAKKVPAAATAPIRGVVEGVYKGAVGGGKAYFGARKQGKGRWASFMESTDATWEAGGKAFDLAIKKEWKQTGRENLTMRELSKDVSAVKTSNQAKENMKNAGIDINDMDALRGFANDETRTDEERKHAYHLIAENGKLNEDDMPKALKVFEKDSTGKREFMKAVKDNQITLAYDVAKDAEKIKTDVEAGKLKFSQLSARELQEPIGEALAKAILNAEFGMKGTESFVKDAKRTSAQSTAHEKIIQQTLLEQTNKANARKKMATNGQKPEAKKERQALSKALVDLTGDMSAFVSADKRGNDGMPTDPIDKGSYDQDAVKGYIASSSPAQLIKLDINENVRGTVAKVIRVQKLSNMAQSREEGAEDQVNKIVKQLVDDKNNSKLQAIAEDPRIFNSLNNDLRNNISKMKLSSGGAAPTPAIIMPSRG